ncbi:ABC transporter permease [Amorphus orientalis]|uniref:ABC-2 type transport system permease protein n=1 Tax=Amorphus orientalis TaxID=649198 RepID=A0AAE3VMP9_9HYPH|nr:ABC transporter permease [Amorphus orientalis]MDQ0314511.1 ABC-2 type transport system permease protein [Amorphus orientalis]
MRLANIFQLGIKELRSLSRDRTMMILMFYVFTLAIYAEASAIPDTLNRAPIAIVDEDRSPLSTRIVDALYPPYFLPPKLITHDEMDARMDEGLDTFALNIPPDFQRDVLAGRQPAIQLNVDATRMTQAFTGSAYVTEIVSDEIRTFTQRYRAEAELPVDLVLRSRFNPELAKEWFGSVTELINNVTLLAIILTGAALIREREHGTIEHLLVMPVTPLEIMAAKVWAMSLIVFLATTGSLLFVVQGLLNVQIQGSIPLFLAGAALEIFAATSLGILIGTIARSMPQFGMLVILVLLPMQMLSGGMTPRESMPEVVQTIMLAAPNTHFVVLAQAVLFRGAGIDVVWPQFAALIAIGAILFMISLSQFRRSMSTMS